MASDRSCRICAAAARPIFNGTVLGRSVEYQECDACGYVQTETPTWLDQAYGSAIGAADTGILQRNRRSARVVVRMLAMLGLLRGRVIDSAGGYGLLVRMLRDLGVDARWEDRYCENLVARGFEAAAEDRADLLTAFEVMEHLVDPLADLKRLCARAPHVLVSTSLIPAPTPRLEDWWYYAPSGGQHIGFFRLRTLEHLGAQLGRRVFSDGRGFHLFTSAASITPLQFAWARKTAALAPLIARLRLQSLTWDDFHATERQAAATRERCDA
jgi:Methyltransferase domain